MPKAEIFNGKRLKLFNVYLKQKKKVGAKVQKTRGEMNRNP